MPHLLRAAVWLLAACNTNRQPDSGPCPGGLCVADDPACAGVVCDTPPSRCHQALGTCAAGACTYAVTAAASCDDGNACTDGDTCAADGTCAGTPRSCNAPGAPTCVDAGTSRVYNRQGACQGGSCVYTYNDVSCPGACNGGTGLCPDPCSGVSCNSPPTACYTTPGTCDLGACDYSVDPGVTGCSDGDPCTTGDACQPGGACVGTALPCDSPPADTCVDANTRRTSSAVGATCSGGTCSYPSSDTPCPSGCSGGACLGTCDEGSCNPWRLPATPNGTMIRDCSDAQCSEAQNLPALDFNYFECNVQPVFNMSCAMSGCHSPRTPQRRLRLYGRMFERVDPLLDGAHGDGPMDMATCKAINCDVDPLTGFEMQWNYDSARMLAAEASSPSLSELLTQPLAGDVAGRLHEGFDMFRSTADVRYQALLAWLGGATATANCGGRMTPVTNGPAAGSIDDYGCPPCMGGGGTCGGAAPDTPPCDPAVCMP